MPDRVVELFETMQQQWIIIFIIISVVIIIIIMIIQLQACTCRPPKREKVGHIFPNRETVRTQRGRQTNEGVHVWTAKK